MQLIHVKNPTPKVRTWTNKDTGEVVEFPELEIWVQTDAFGYPEKSKITMDTKKDVDEGWYFIPDSNFFINAGKFGALQISQKVDRLIPADEDMIKQFMSLQLSEKQTESYMLQRA